MDDIALLEGSAPAPEADLGSASVGTGGAGATGADPGHAVTARGRDGAAGAAPEPAPAAEAPESAGTSAPEPVEIDYPEDAEEAADETAPAPEAAGTAEPEPDAHSARFGTAALTRLLREQPELAKAAEQNPRARAQLYQMARRSQDLAKYQEVLPSLARAQEAVEAADALANYDRAYFGDSPESFWRGLYDAQVQADPATGQRRSSGVYERNVQFLHQIFLDRVAQQAAREGNEDLTTAVQAIRGSLGWGNSRTARPQASEGQQRGFEQETNLPPHIRQRLEQAEQNARELEQLRSRRSGEERQKQETFLDETASEAGRELRGFVDGLLANSRLSDYDKANIARDFLERVSELADQDKVHNAALEEILRAGGASPQTRSQMVARVKAWARQNGRDILEPILQRAGAGLKQRQQQREAVRAKARTEPAAAGAPANPRQPSARDLVKGAEAKLGRRLTDREILELA
ncbi:MAG TPA: hypothetical protein VNF74_11375 [Terriglobales bacterium]|nr:hypothetical protein [Terriglobales bacterium]